MSDPSAIRVFSMVPRWNIPEVNALEPEAGALGAYRSALDLIEVPGPEDRGRILRFEAGVLLDRLAVRLARGRGALDLAIGQKLGELWNVSGELDHGYSCLEDLAREKLGLSAAFARRLVRLERSLRKRLLLRDAVFSGAVTRRKAEIVLPRAKGEDEARWVELARTRTARWLQEAVKEAAEPGRTAEPGPDGCVIEDEERTRRIREWLGDDAGPVLEQALALAALLDEAPRTLDAKLRCLAMEYLSGHAAPEVPEGKRPSPEYVGERVEPGVDLRAWLEREASAWAFLFEPLPVPAPALEVTSPPDAYTLLDELRGLVRLRNRWDEELGRACLRMQIAGLWRAIGFASLAHYCDERLGLGASTVKQRVALERRMTELPPLREAMRAGRLSYEQARLVARGATPATVEARIEEAAGKTCLELQRKVQAREEGQMWERKLLDAYVTEETSSLLAEAVRAARAAAGKWLTPWAALKAIAQHAIDVWTPMIEAKLEAAHPTKLRDRCLCQVPGCSRVADEVHHVWLRSQGGPLEGWNEVSLCRIHHLRGVHAGNLWVYGVAPGQLTWILGWREVRAWRAAPEPPSGPPDVRPAA